MKDITNAACDKTVEQATLQTIRDQVLTAQGPVVPYRSFKHGKQLNKHIAEAEYTRALQALEEDGFGRLVEFNVPRARRKCKVFIKSKPDPWPSTATVSATEFDSAFARGIHSDISGPMRANLQSENYISS